MSTQKYLKMPDTWCIISDSNALRGDVVVTTKAGVRKVETITDAVGVYRSKPETQYIYDFVQRPRRGREIAEY
jgi:aspartokinase-like uncharacterized kinase